jgi:preprotein translocase subunit Sss1
LIPCDEEWRKMDSLVLIGLLGVIVGIIGFVVLYKGRKKRKGP